MTRAAMLLLSLLILPACGADGGSSNQPDAGQAGQADAGQRCPNAIASDENCGACLKAWGSGASYCAAGCSADLDCAGMTSAWGSEPLVCHADGYCTRTCSAAADCYLGDGADYTCDDGRCTVCIDCY